MFGEGEWAAAQHGGHGRRGWRKLHLGVNRSGVIVAQALTDATTDDALTGITLMGAVDGNVASVTADPAYDTIAFYDAATEHGAKVVCTSSWIGETASPARSPRARPASFLSTCSATFPGFHPSCRRFTFSGSPSSWRRSSWWT